jgi:hypothetical protein
MHAVDDETDERALAGWSCFGSAGRRHGPVRARDGGASIVLVEKSYSRASLTIS